MSRAYDFTVATVVTLVAITWHRMAVGFFDPSGALFEAAAGATILNGAARANFWMAIGTVWMPMIAVGGIWLYTLVREYRRQAVTAVQAPR